MRKEKRDPLTFQIKSIVYMFKKCFINYSKSIFIFVYLKMKYRPNNLKVLPKLN